MAAKLCSNSSIHSEPKTSITLAGFFRLPSDEMGAKSEKENAKLGVHPPLESVGEPYISHTDDFDPLVKSFIKIPLPLTIPLCSLILKIVGRGVK